MTFVRISALLYKAFDRIDKKNSLRGEQGRKHLEHILHELLPSGARYTISFRSGVLTIQSSSSMLRHTLLVRKTELLQQIQKKLPDFPVKDILFTGPRQ